MDENPQKAISLKFDASKDTVPIVAAKGDGKYAEDIIGMAKELGVYVHKDPTLLKHLDNLKEGDSIPRPLFLVISEIIAYSYFLQGKTPESWTSKDGNKHINKKV
jgi:flagellar biosynthesis protein